jgi:steroid delta-isomerase-like uncharacterized protein
MSLEENKALVRRHVEEFWNQGQLELADELHTEDIVMHDPSAPEVHGSEAYDQLVIMYRTAFPDIRFTIEELIAEGNLVSERWSASGTHQGELMGIPPTGIHSTNTGISIFRIAGGKIAEEWAQWSTLGMMQQLGVIPPMGEGGE